MTFARPHDLDPAARDRFERIWLQGCRYEWRFWDAAWRGETWPF